MAFHSLCQKIDVDSLRAKFSNFPSLPAMPQLKLPKSMPKLKTRKIFRSSRENINVNKSASLEVAGQTNDNRLQLPSSVPPSQFINHTPQRISTISSLMYEQDNITYRSAHSIDDDYPSPSQYHRSTGDLKPISPIRSIDLMSIPENHLTEETGNNLSIVERIQKGYKDVTEFRFKHIFSKKTVLRKDSIHVDQYVVSFTEERSSNNPHQNESTLRPHSTDYRFQFKESRQKPGHSYSLSSNESISSTRQTNKQSESDEDQCTEKQHRKHGIPRRMSEENTDNEDEPIPCDVEVRQSTLYNIKDSHSSHNTLLESDAATAIPRSRGEIYKNRLKRLTKYAASSIDESGVESATEGAKQHKVKPAKERKRKAPLTPQQSEENIVDKQENTFDMIKSNIKRFHRSLKTHQPSETVDETEEDVGTDKPKTSSRSERIAARLRKFKSHNESEDNIDDPEKTQETGPRSPIRTAIKNKISTFKKSFKKQASEFDNRTGDEASPEKETRSSALIKNLRHIRSKKPPTVANDELDENETKSHNNIRKISKFEQKFDHARKRTLKKVNEKMGKLSFYKRPQDSVGPTDDIKNHSSEEEDDERTNKSEIDVGENDMAQAGQLEKEYTNRAIWTNEPILSDHTDNESESEAEYPRVLIHQDTSDLFESKLVLAVTRSPKPSSSPRIKITESQQQLTSDKEASTEANEVSLRKIPPPRQRRLSEGNAKEKSNNSSQQNSNLELAVPTKMDSNIQSRSQENLLHASFSNLTKADESEDAWKVVGNSLRDEPIYKSKSIDIFEKHTQKDKGAAFEDFDEELKNEPVLRIPIPRTYRLDRESSDDSDGADDDNSSRITKILADSRDNKTPLPNSASNLNISDKQTTIFSNSRESLLANSNENISDYTEDNDDDDEMEGDIDADRPPSAAPSPPPTPVSITPPPTPVSLTPPPLPERRSNFSNEQCRITPPLPVTKPPILAQGPPQIPERTASMSRISKPLVKTSSLRLAYSEQVNPEDVGKVNKLISRFEQPKCHVSQRPRVVLRKKPHNYSDAYSEDEETSSDELNGNDNNDNESHTISKADNPAKTTQNIPELEMRTNNCTNSLQVILPSSNKRINTKTLRDSKLVPNVPTKSESFLGFTEQRVSMCLDRNSKSRSCVSSPTSEYGSPLEFPSSLMGSPETTPVPVLKRASAQNRRSVGRDDDIYLSFDSDEENSYYSISPAGSNRYIVDL